jgi:hypothetical protein
MRYLIVILACLAALVDVCPAQEQLLTSVVFEKPARAEDTLIIRAQVRPCEGKVTVTLHAPTLLSEACSLASIEKGKV